MDLRGTPLPWREPCINRPRSESRSRLKARQYTNNVESSLPFSIEFADACRMLQAMESANDSQFDVNVALQLLLEIAHEQSLEKVLQKILDTAAEQPGVACVQFWLIDKGDLCAQCPQRPDCPDQARCLHLIAGRGVPLPGSEKKPTRFGDANARIPLGVGAVGEAVSRKEQVYLRDPAQIAKALGIDWVQTESVAFCDVTPIIFREEVLGVSLGMGREHPRLDARPWGRVVADHIGAAIVNARAFDEIQHLKAQLEQQNTYLKEEVIEAKAFGSLVGQSAALRQNISQIDLVAPTEASVLILGETGTGKELVAHEIHRRSRRKEGPLIRVNCPSIPRDLFESEFFGHVKGAFTGAIKDRAGRFEAAEGGTIF